ncbi:hypothetical protein CDO73_03565 [Saccharibacillus sp. O23]|uniref:hypothetical protein n=1 Tax=Saccharibacillus sp. O23 TaxID=2009338 RepID=UPI000B4E13CD|nr:hypothetical protein [Saccharibacillus sp. O23]OWR32690.1 hypothetical protein CDO73_03565 [Saccharibacillus sp. O23]
MIVETLPYDGSSEQLVELINEQADKGLRLVSVQNIDSGNFVSFVPKDFFTPNEQLSKAQERIAELEKADLDNKKLINGLAEIILGGM